MKCNTLIKVSSPYGIDYVKCGKKVKYEVTYKEGTRGKIVTEFICGIHLQSLIKWSDRVKKKLNWDSELEVKEIN